MAIGLVLNATFRNRHFIFINVTLVRFLLPWFDCHFAGTKRSRHSFGKTWNLGTVRGAVETAQGGVAKSKLPLETETYAPRSQLPTEPEVREQRTAEGKGKR